VKKGIISFDEILKELPKLLKEVELCDLIDRNNLKDIPNEGIYIFYEHGKPKYVGRSNNLKNRLLSHGRPSSDHYSATFAFNIAKYDAEIKRLPIDLSDGRNKLQNNPDFKKLFDKAKEKVAGMKIRVIEVRCQHTQAIFEIYVALNLKTEFNDFGTH